MQGNPFQMTLDQRFWGLDRDRLVRLFLKLCLYTILLLIPLLFWIGAKRHFEFPKFMAFRFLILCALGAWLTLEGHIRNLRSPYTLGALVYIFGQCLSTLAAPNVTEAMDVKQLPDQVLLMFFVLLVYKTIRSPRNIHFALIVYAICSSLSAFYGLVQYYGIDRRLFEFLGVASLYMPTGKDPADAVSTAGNVNFAAEYLGAVFPLMLAMTLVPKRKSEIGHLLDRILLIGFGGLAFLVLVNVVGGGILQSLIRLILPPILVGWVLLLAVRRPFILVSFLLLGHLIVANTQGAWVGLAVAGAVGLPAALSWWKERRETILVAGGGAFIILAIHNLFRYYWLEVLRYEWVLGYEINKIPMAERWYQTSGTTFNNVTTHWLTQKIATGASEYWGMMTLPLAVLFLGLLLIGFSLAFYRLFPVIQEIFGWESAQVRMFRKWIGAGVAVFLILGSVFMASQKVTSGVARVREMVARADDRGTPYPVRHWYRRHLPYSYTHFLDEEYKFRDRRPFDQDHPYTWLDHLLSKSLGFTATFRLECWRGASRNLVFNMKEWWGLPLIGIGQGNFKVTHPMYEFESDLERKILGVEVLARKVHNDFLCAGLEFGLFGIFGLFLLLVTAIRNCYLGSRQYRFLRERGWSGERLNLSIAFFIGGLASVVTMSVHANFSSNFLQPSSSVAFWFLVGLLGGLVRYWGGIRTAMASSPDRAGAVLALGLSPEPGTGEVDISGFGKEGDEPSRKNGLSIRLGIPIACFVGMILVWPFSMRHWFGEVFMQNGMRRKEKIDYLDRGNYNYWLNVRATPSGDVELDPTDDDNCKDRWQIFQSVYDDFNKSLRFYPQYMETYYILGRYYIDGGDYCQRQYFREVGDDPNALVWLDRAEDLFKRGRDVLLKDIYMNPNYKWAHNNLGVIYDKLASVTGEDVNRLYARYHYQRALEIDPEQIFALYNLATGYYRDGIRGGTDSDLRLAQRYFERSLQVDPRKHDCHVFLGKIHERFWEFGKAVDSLEKYIARGKEQAARDEEAWTTLGVSYMECIARDIPVSPNSAARPVRAPLGPFPAFTIEDTLNHVAIQLAWSYEPLRTEELLDRAEEVLERARNLTRNNPQAINQISQYLSNLKMRRGDLAGAIDELKKTYGERPRSSLVLIELARLYRLQGNHEAARESLLASLSADAAPERVVAVIRADKDFLRSMDEDWFQPVQEALRAIEAATSIPRIRPEDGLIPESDIIERNPGEE